jgi:peptide/nickel transport system substrate-binding protein
MRLNRLTVAGVAAIAALSVLVGCTPSPPNETGTTTGTTNGAATTLTAGFTLEPATLDLTVSDAASIPQVLLYNVYETLIKQDASGAIKPLLATDYEVSTDGLKYTFHLDPKATFASGTPVNAEAVKSSIERMRTATNNTIVSSMAIISSVEAKDTRTVVITLSRPSNLWVYDMTSTAGVIIDPAATDLATAPMGSGPYMYDTWVQGDRVTLKKNPSYWGTPGRFEHVVFRYIPDPNAMVSAMLSGDIDLIGELTSPDSLNQFSDTAKYQIIEGSSNAEVVLGFNHSRETLSNLKVRQAINYAIDRQALVNTAWGGKGQLIGSMDVPTDAYYEDLSNTYPYDPDKARQLLADAGYASGLTLALRIPIAPYTTPAAQFIASELAQVGVTVTIEELDFTRWLTDVYLGGNYDMTIVSHVEARDITRWASPDYYWHYDNPAFQALLTKADQEPRDQFITDMKAAAKILADDAAADFLFMFPNLIVARVGITGIPENLVTLSFDVTTIAAKG